MKEILESLERHIREHLYIICEDCLEHDIDIDIQSIQTLYYKIKILVEMEKENEANR
tara:strand:- start:58 stop:228 length:171 start_codon:yes stop_codon:yes gene_type:complete